MASPSDWRNAYMGGHASHRMSPQETRRAAAGQAVPLPTLRRGSYFSLIIVVLLPEPTPTVSSEQTLVCLMRSCASSRDLNASGPICVTTSRSAGLVVVIVQ